ncbi:MAG: hypothetical protein NTX15_06145, partial [Candidatus Kapabacteria bacterium]|nr:hypothetical protein [Candidatus Kapabacteria bacterium]
MITTRLIFALLTAITLLSATPFFSAGTDREGKEHLRRRFEEFRKRRVPHGVALDANIRSVAIDQMRLAPSKFNVEAQADQPKWSQVGPRSTAGRIKSIVCDRKNPGTVYIGAAAGGVWKSTNEGNTWTPLMDQANAIAMGALCIAPDDPSTIYAGTGEQVIGANIFLGAGLLRSTDKGVTWNVIGLADVGSFSRVLIHPSAPSTIMASCMNEKAGVWKSTDRGATWKRILEGQIYDMSMNVVDANEWFVAVKDSGIMATTDGGATWRRRMTGLVGEVGRVSVQHVIGDPDILFALLELNSLAVIAKSTDKGLTWNVVFRDKEGCFFSGTCVLEESQGFYNNVVSVSPHSNADVIVCGIDVWVSRDGGDTWRNATNGYADADGNNHPHVDQHCVAWDPQKPGEVYVGNDGGMMKTWDTGQTWLPINNDLSVTQFYAFDVDRAARGRMFGGTQDNGTLGTSGSADWDTLYGGDGMTTLLDPSNSNILYGSGPKGDLFKLTLNTSSSKRILAGVDLAEKCEWVAPVIIDPLQTTTLFTGRERIYRSDDAGESWRAVSPRLSNTVTAIAISPADQEVVWAGGSYGEVLLSTDYGENWKSVNQFDIPSLLYVSSIACARRDGNVAWLTYSSYGTPQVIKTTDLGVTWRSVWNFMPNVPVNAIVLHPDDDNIAFVGTDIGVFATYDGGYTWTPFGEGLPRSPVLSLRADATFSYLRAATHGRSIWEAPLIKKEPTEPMITAPLGGERFLALTRIGIGWSRFGNTTKETYNVEFTTNDGLSWVSVAQGVTGQHEAWTVPNTPTPSARIRVSSQSTPSAVVESRSFAIVRRERGVILDQDAQSWAPYGIAWDGSDGLWMTNIHSATIFHVKQDSYFPVNALTIKGAGDSLFTDIAYDRDSALIYVHRLDDF